MSSGCLVKKKKKRIKWSVWIVGKKEKKIENMGNG